MSNSNPKCPQKPPQAPKSYLSPNNDMHSPGTRGGLPDRGDQLAHFVSPVDLTNIHSVHALHLLISWLFFQTKKLPPAPTPPAQGGWPTCSYASLPIPSP